MGQNLPLKDGKYVLKFDWTSRVGTVQPSNTFEVRINGKILKSFSSNNYNLNQENI